MSASLLVGWAIEALIASTVLMIAVLAIRGPVRRAFGPDIVYALWALPALRLLLPPIPESWREIAVAPVIRASETITYYVIEPLGGGAAASASPYPSPGFVLVTLWVAGAAAFLGFHAISHLQFCRNILAKQVRGEEMDNGIRLIETDGASGPLAFGIIRKYVAFPRDFTERYDREERDLALAHELGHHARGDLIANWIALLVLALHWFNPIAWRAFRAFRADQEIANDARVLAGMNPMARHTYACAIVKSAHGGAVSAACHLHTINDLKGRLRMLTTNRTSRTRLVSGVAAIGLLTVAGLGFTASGTKAAAAIRSNVETATGVDLANLDITPPAAPMTPMTPMTPLTPMPPSAVAPTEPAAPQSADLPPPPPAPPAPPAWTGEDRDVSTVVTEGPDGRKIKRVKIVMRDKDGKVRTENFEGMEALKNMPEISEGNCPEGGNRKEMVINTTKGDKRIMIICKNRIEKMASESAEIAANSKDIQRNAMQSAIAGLRTARASITGNSGMTPQQRDEALKGIDEAIREVTEEMGKAN